MDDHTAKNRARWDELAPLHVESAFYDVPGFLAGNCSVGALELSALGDLRGRSLLHLQCHIGLDTLSLARLGAKATGVDYSETATREARRLSERSGIDARFVCANVYALDLALRETFDIVYCSHGVLIWLPDLNAWAKQVAARLRGGGRFYLIDEHPLSLTLDETPEGYRVARSYFRGAQPIEERVLGSYANRDASIENDRAYTWIHPLSDLVNALVRAGLTVIELREYPWAAYRQFSRMVPSGARGYRSPDVDVPYLFAITAERRP